MPHARILAATTALLCGTAFLAVAPAQAQDGGFRDCLNNIKADALKQGVPASVIDRAFQGLTPDQKVVDLDNRQPEFSQIDVLTMGATCTVSISSIARHAAYSSSVVSPLATSAARKAPCCRSGCSFFSTSQNIA